VSKIHPHDIFQKIGSFFPHNSGEKGDSDETRPDINSTKLVKLSNIIVKHPDLLNYNFEHEDILIIASAWFEHIVERKLQFDPIELLHTIFPDRETCINQLDRIVTLLKRNIFYTQKKQVLNLNTREHSSNIKYFKYYLLEYDICFHRTFTRQLLNEQEDVNLKFDEPYCTNKEFVSDWFSYVAQLHEFSFYGFENRRYGADLDEGPANDLIKALEWKERIERRMINTKEEFPLSDIVDEYKLEHNEAAILMYLVKEDMEGNQVDTDEIIGIISRDQHELYTNKKFISTDSKLVKHGLVELSENIFFRSNGGEVRVSPDITRQIIMKTPVHDDERLTQILKGNDIFTLLEPTHNMTKLILPSEMKKTIKTSISQYSDNVDRILSSWGLFEGETTATNKLNKKLEPGLLMLFYGPPGTGKTFAASTIAKSLGKKLLVSDISRIQSKWVGDSEKNVRRMFSVFERVVRRTENPPVLLLNEADQFLSSRVSTMNTAVDVMYNTMQNLFLEAFERLKGVMIATTNLRDNLDLAFSRRFHLKMEFPFPGVKERADLWKLHLPESIPGSQDIDVTTLAKTYPLTGGQISIIVKNAATEAASRKGKIKKIMFDDLIKYCEIESTSMFDYDNLNIGFRA